MTRKIQNILVLIYFPFFFVCIEITKIIKIDSLIVLSNLPLLFYLLINTISKEKRPSKIRKDFLLLFILFYMLLQMNSTFRIDSIYMASANTITLISLYFFSMSLYKMDSITYLEEIIKYFLLSILLAFILVVIPLLLKGNFVIGNHYTLLFDANKTGADQIPFLKTTLDAPNLSSIVFLILFYLILKKNVRYFININYSFLVLIFIISIIEIILINRRGPMLGAIVSISFLLSPRLIISFIPLLLFVPFYWDYALKILVPLFYNSPLSNLIVNKDYSNLVEAGARSTVWEVIGGLFINPSFSYSYLFGYGYLPELEYLGGYGHAHNGFLQLFLLSGIISVLLLLFISVITIIRSFYLLKTKEFTVYKFLPLVLFFLLFISASESIFFSNFFTNNLFLVIIFLINVSYYHKTKLKHKMYAIK